MKKILFFALTTLFLTNFAYSQTTPTVYDYTAIKNDILERGNRFVNQIDLSVKPKAKNEGCNNSVLRHRSKALDLLTKLEVAVADLPDKHYQGGASNMVCETVTATASINKTKAAFTALFNGLRSLTNLEKTCKAKYALSYRPVTGELTTVYKELRTIPRKVISCY